jgi:hypothetical protein
MRDSKRSIVESGDDNAPWQFSLRNLFLFVTFVSVLLGIGVYYGGIVVALIAICVTQAALLFSADQLIRPSHRRALAFVTSAAWAILASNLAVVAFIVVFQAVVYSDALRWILAACLWITGAFCFALSSLRWRQRSGGSRSKR